MKKRITFVCVTTILALMLAGCDNKTHKIKENIYEGSTEPTIEEILDGHALGDGEPIEVIESTTEKNKEEISEAVNKLLEENNGYEYYKVVGSNGDWSEDYLDINTGKSLINQYNLNGKLIHRTESNLATGRITTLYLNEETNEYEARTELVANNLIEENKKLIGHSYIMDFFNNNIKPDTEKQEFTTKEKQGDYFIYSTDTEYKVCVNTKTNMLERIVRISDDSKGKFTSDVLYEFKIFDKLTDEELSIYAKGNEDIDFSEIEIIDHGQQEDVSGEAVG